MNGESKKEMKTDRQISSRKIGLALGSGSARGWAHIGVLQALGEAGIGVDYMAGTSIGALVGAVYAAGKLDALRATVLQFDWKRTVSFFDVVFPKAGLIDGKKVADFIRSRLKEKNIEELPLAFCAVSTDLATGREVVLREGNLIEAIRASISVPGIFTPVKKEDTFLVDGGLVNPIPVSAARQMGAEFVIAVDLNHDIVTKRGISHSRSDTSGSLTAIGQSFTKSRPIRQILDAINKRTIMLDAPVLAQVKRWIAQDPVPNIFEVLTTSINIMEVQITATRLRTDPPDLLIQPNLGHIRFLDFHRAQEAIDEGYREASIQIATFIEKKA